METIAIDLLADLLNLIDARCEKATPKVGRSEVIHFALMKFLGLENATEEEKRQFWAREETEKELDALVEQASMSGLREFHEDEPPWPDLNE